MATPTSPALPGSYRTPARHAAVVVLAELEDADLPPQALLDKAHLEKRDRPFATELVMGTLRNRALLDYTLAPLLKKPLLRLDAPVRAALRLAAYERAILGTPPQAVGNEYAGLMKRLRLASATAFINAVTRRLPPEPRQPPPLSTNPLSAISIGCSHPEWIVRRWLDRFGVEECRALCAANNEMAPLSLRVNATKVSREDILNSFCKRKIEASAGKLSDVAVLVARYGEPTTLDEWRGGEVIAQDEAAQLAVPLMRLKPGDVVIDVAAAPGGKTTQIAEILRGTGKLFACDRSALRLGLVAENLDRLGLRDGVELIAGDFRDTWEQLPEADAVLLDAPCLGTGTWRRRPDARWKKSDRQLGELVKLQQELLKAAALRVKPGGCMVYSTCSLEPEENELQMEWWVHRCQTGGNDEWTAQTVRQTLPHRDGCDGMFACRLQRSA